MKRILTLIIGLLPIFLFGQIPVGQFRVHIPLHAFHSVAVADDYVYAATSNGLMMLEKSTRDSETPSLTSWSKVDGLSDIDITRILYHSKSGTLAIAYANGNLDLIVKEKLYNISDIKNKQLTGSKKPLHLRAFGQRLYIAYSFGVVVVDMDSRLIEDTWFTKIGNEQYIANDIAISDDRYYIATDRGIFSLDRRSSNPANFSEWTLEATAGNTDFDIILAFGGRVYANKNLGNGSGTPMDTLYVRADEGWQATPESFSDVRAITTNGTEMVVTNWDFVKTFDSAFNSTFIAYWFDESSYPNCEEAVLENDLIWAADNSYGLVQYNRAYYYYKTYTMSGPFATTAESLCSVNGITAVVPGSRKGAAYVPGWLQPSVSWFSNQQWHYKDLSYLNHNLGMDIYDLTNVAVNPNNDAEWYLASWGNGLLKFQNGELAEHYNAANSPLDSTSSGSTFVSGLAYDKKGNLWLTNSQSSTMLKMMEPDGTWHAFNISSGVVTSSPVNVVAENLLIDSRGYKWVTFPREDNFNRYHLVAFDDNGTYDDPVDDKLARVNMNVAAEVSSSTVHCLAEDLDGEIWIGTDKGVKVIYYPANIFKGTAHPRNILLEQDGYVSVLLEWESVTAIAVDGANRKWIGTNKAGVFLMSEDGQEQLLHFTAEDNPLFANQISSISIDPLSGEVFFGTPKGITSYRGTASAGREQYEDLPVFPNPVRHDYNGPVTVQGLKANSLCKISDASGKLVWQGYSNGGELVWYCKDHFGQRPETGVYYVMCSDKDGKEKIVTKFLFIR
jgi:ligand-binding sensor domain-containing protein